MIIEENDISKWATSIDNFKPEYIPVKCNSILQFYTLRDAPEKDVLMSVKKYAKEIKDKWGKEVTDGGAMSLSRKHHGLLDVNVSNEITTANIVPMRYVHYALFSPQEDKYYFKFWYANSLDVWYFYRKTLEFSGDDISIERLRTRIDDGNVWILFSKQQVADVTDLLKRVFKGQFNEEGKVPYPIYLQLLQQIVDYEDYHDKCKGVTGFKTVCNQYDTRIKELWDKAYNSKKAE